jgi:hypothetical protein
MNGKQKAFLWIAAGCACLLFSCVRMGPVSPQASKPKRIGQSDRPSRPAVCKLKSGELLVAFLAGDATDSRKTLVMSTRSRNQGKSWTSLRPILNAVRYAVHPSFTQLRDGRVILVYGTVQPDRYESYPGFYQATSPDRGETFDEARFFPVRGGDLVQTFDSVLELENGTLLLPLAMKKTGGIESVFLMVSNNKGQTWDGTRPFLNTTENKIGFFNPSLRKLDNGRLLCIMETSGTDGFLYQTVSDDSGKTWSPAVSTGIQGALPDWFQSPSGTLFLSYRDFWPGGLSLSRSYRFGTVWEKETSLSGTGDPAVFQRMVPIDSSRAMVFFFSGSEKSGATLWAASFDVGQTRTPKGFSASIHGRRSVVLRWNAVPSADYYFVYRDRRPEFDLRPGYPYWGNALATSTATEYTDAPVDSGKIYYYRITAVSGRGKVVSGSGSESDPTKAIGVNVK